MSVIVPAAGCGARAGLNGNKVLAPLQGRPLLWWTLRNLARASGWPAGVRLHEVIVAARPTEFPLIEPLFTTLHGSSTPGDDDLLRCQWRLVEGGATRQDSVFAAAEVAAGDFLLVHDAARPALSPALKQRVCEAALDCGAAIAALPVADTVKVVRAVGETPRIKQTLDRAAIWLAQTPQVFRRAILLEALQQARLDNYAGTDCASLVERLLTADGDMRYPVCVIEGEPQNLKVTYAADLERAAGFIA